MYFALKSTAAKAMCLHALSVGAGRTHEPQVVQDVENLYAGIFLKNRLRYRVAQN